MWFIVFRFFVLALLLPACLAAGWLCVRPEAEREVPIVESHITSNTRAGNVFCVLKSKTGSPVSLIAVLDEDLRAGSMGTLALDVSSEFTGLYELTVDLPAGVSLVAGASTFHGIIKKDALVRHALQIRVDDSSSREIQAQVQLKLGETARFSAVAVVQLGDPPPPQETTATPAKIVAGKWYRSNQVSTVKVKQ